MTIWQVTYTLFGLEKTSQGFASQKDATKFRNSVRRINGVTKAELIIK